MRMVSDPVARFTTVFQSHYPRILAYVRRRVDEGWADDVVAEVFLAAWRHIDGLPDEPLPWLYRTAAQCVANQDRGRRRQQQLANRIAISTDGASVSEDHAEVVAEANLLAVALAKISPADREALLLVAWEGLDSRTAAYVLNCSRIAFRTRLHRARRRLARLLDEQPTPAANALVAVKEL